MSSRSVRSRDGEVAVDPFGSRPSIIETMQSETKIVVVAGLSSNVGKTTLASHLVAALPGWEAVKVTKGHYRSCGKDPHACCVSHLLSDAPLVLSGRERTYALGKDTGAFWDAGASNVHWVIATKEQVADGVRAALARVAPDCPGVLVEGTGFVRTVPADYVVMVARADQREVKASAASIFALADALYVSRAEAEVAERGLERIRDLLAARRVDAPLPPLFLDADLPRLVAEINRRSQKERRDRSRPAGRAGTV
jgi:molybdopterin-guanine dinucleotide biosynthesis protein